AERHVLPADGGEPEGPVLLRVLLPAWPEETQVDEAHGGGENPVPGQALGFQVPPDHAAQVRQGLAELQHPVVLLPVALDPPQIVVPVLAPPGRVGPHGLDMAPRIRADPYVLPGRRDDQGSDAVKHPRIRDGFGTRPEIAEAAAAATAPDSLAAEVAAAQ